MVGCSSQELWALDDKWITSQYPPQHVMRREPNSTSGLSSSFPTRNVVVVARCTWLQLWVGGSDVLGRGTMVLPPQAK